MFAWLFDQLRLSLLPVLLLGAAFSVYAAKSYSDNGDGTVTDPITGLTWMRCAAGQTWTGSTCSGVADTLTFDQALVPSSPGWRLPSIRELQTIVDRTSSVSGIDAEAFPNTPKAFFWSGTPYASAALPTAWALSFDDGTANPTTRSDLYAVRLVRGAQSVSLLNLSRPTSDYVDNADGTVTHTPTGLTWQRCAQGQTWGANGCAGTVSGVTWSAATQLSSSFAGKTDWRLPTQDELLSLVDYALVGPAINSTVFPATPRAYFWSSLSNVFASSYAWVVNFGDGSAFGSAAKAGSYGVRLVRGGFTYVSLPLSVVKSGAGTVTSTLGGINCGSVCSANFTSGTSVRLTAIPQSGNVFAGWSGACSGTGVCVVSVSNAAQSVTATFSAAPGTFKVDGGESYPLRAGLTIDSNGVVTGGAYDFHKLDGTMTPCTHSAANDATCHGASSSLIVKAQSGPLTATGAASPTTLVAGPDAFGFTFVGTLTGATWSGIWTNSSLNLPVAARTGTFSVILFISKDTSNASYPVTISRSGTGSGTVTSSPAAIACGSVCSALVPSGVTGSLIVTPDAGSTFTGWSGDCTGTGACTLTINGAKNVTASFKLIPFAVATTGVVAGVIVTPIATVTNTIVFEPKDVGKTGSIFITAIVPSSFLSSLAPKQSAINGLKVAAATAPSTLILVQLTPTGWQPVSNGQLIPYATGVLGDQLAAQTILNNTNTTSLAGAQFCVGYGTSASEMNDADRMQLIASIPDPAAASSASLSCLVTASVLVPKGWSLLGNSQSQSLQVGALYSDASWVTSVWSWDASQKRWQFYAPNLDASALQSYASEKNYGVLTDIKPGEGYWVSATASASVMAQSGAAFNLGNANLLAGWNLVSTATAAAPSTFIASMGTTVTSLWAWDADTQNWYFYAPSLAAQGSSLASYISSNGYLDFTAANKTLGSGVGFWVNKP
jgi:hypothetical protein